MQSIMSEDIKVYVMPTLFIIGGAILGWFAEKLIIAKLKVLSQKTQSVIDDILVHSLHHLIIFWFTAAGIYISLHKFPIPKGTNEILIKIYWSIIIFSFTLFTSRVLVETTKVYTSKISGLSGSVSVFTTIVKIIVFSIGIMIILQHFGVSIAPILTALGVGGLAVALALQDTLSNLFAGIHILVSKQIKIGNRIKMDNNIEGYITDITWRNTLIKTTDENLIIIPNSKFAQSTITNVHLPDKKNIYLIECGVAYDSDLEEVEKILLEIGKKIQTEYPGSTRDFTPVVRYYSFGDSAILFRLILSVENYEDRFLLAHEAIKLIHKTFKEKGIEIPFPQRVVHLHNNK